ncbi:ileal sodium/bile acid cotransporter-like [Uloborus diversus]|uniref:ileal sodium/bile acid cotransporter-like n=1 Tax=Uloborus diversus TaxID=327109 RepID=UPI00240A83EA|nr:ileal sodium/bile acid cotransporter-like [Uloborus diversus]
MESLNDSLDLVMMMDESFQNNHSDVLNETITLEKELFELNQTFKPVIDYLLLTILIVIMLAMGCEITWTQLKSHLVRPIGISIGLVSQFLIKPLVAYALMRSINVKGLHATGVLIISCCPGGVLSNAFTYFCDGDLPLSVAMTSFSTLLAMGLMPLNLWIYGRSFETQSLVLPYGNLALSLVLITAPVVIGMFLRWKWQKLAGIISKVSSYLGIVIVLICIILEVIVFPNMFTGVPGKLYGLVLLLPLVGLGLGFGSAFMFRQTMSVMKTIAIECGIQNVPTALTIISLSFAPELQGDIILLPWLYAFAMMSACTVICFTYQIHKRYIKNRAKKEDIYVVAKQDTLPMEKCPA